MYVARACDTSVAHCKQVIFQVKAFSRISSSREHLRLILPTSVKGRVAFLRKGSVRNFVDKRRRERRRCSVIVDIHASITRIYIHDREYTGRGRKISRRSTFSLAVYQTGHKNPSPSCVLVTSIFSRIGQYKASPCRPAIAGYCSALRADQNERHRKTFRTRSRMSYTSRAICRRARIRTIERGR